MLRLLSGQNIYSVNDSDIFMELKRLLSLGLDIIEELQFENRSPELSDTFFQLEHLFNQMCTLLDAH